MKRQTQYVALLRGINVGGKSLIKMADLKACFEASGFSDVSTYIASGNVLFASREASVHKLAETIEKALEKSFALPVRVLVLSKKDLAAAVKSAPKGFGTEPAKYRYDVIYLLPPLTAKEAIKNVPAKEGVDTGAAGKDVLFFSRLIAKAMQSRLSRIAKSPIYKHITIRNWNTTTKLLALMEQRKGESD